MKRRTGHLKIAKAYNVPVGGAIALCVDKVKSGIPIGKIWPHDGVHPGDFGYQIFAEAAIKAFHDALASKMKCAAPEAMLHADTYMKSARVRLSSLAKLPLGWKAGTPNLVSAWYDALMSRWLDDLTIASPGCEPLEVKFNGSVVIVFGESTTSSCKFKVTIDGKLAAEKDASAKRFGGNTHLSPLIVEGLDADVEHSLKLEPVFGEPDQKELRIESICVAGGEAKVWIKK